MTARRPRIGILGIMQDLYDDMIPGIAQRQAGYAAELAAQLADVGEFIPAEPIKYREDAERVMGEFERAGLDGVLVVMLTYGPAMRVARLLSESRLPICLANIQPEPSVTPAWDMADMTYNQGVHGAQDTANAMVRAGRRFHVLTDDWKSGVVPRRRGPVGAGRRGGHPVAVAEGGDLRLRDERHGRHPGRRERADPVARPGDPGRRARRHVPGHAGGHRRPGRRRDRGRGRPASRSTRGCRRPSARTTPGCRSRSRRSWTTAGSGPTPRTSTRSARTAGSAGCRWPPRPR